MVLVGIELTALLVEAPREVPELLARRLRELSGAARCDILVRDGDRLRLVVSVDDGGAARARPGSAWPLRRLGAARRPPR